MTIRLGNFKIINDLCKNISECYAAGAIKNAMRGRKVVTMRLNSSEGAGGRQL